jgi:hypothetical protein
MNGLTYSLPKSMGFCQTAFFTAALVFSLSFFFATCLAQEPDNEDEAPPPLKYLSKDEKQKLDGEANVKNRTSLSLELMERRIESVESLNSAKRFDDMFKELGGFNALMDDALKFLVDQDKGPDKSNGKVLNNLKKLDIGLRSFLPRLETVHRDLPERYEPYVRKLIKFIHEAREKALEPMFGNTVVPDRPDH